mmetsp:Transcript_12975/g.21340  ORF Transcript_12975/g.21340 Transcript_12975/m.21340 type:complete len:95 (+) Transcript_12975:269-553(+)
MEIDFEKGGNQSNVSSVVEVEEGEQKNCNEDNTHNVKKLGRTSMERREIKWSIQNRTNQVRGHRRMTTVLVRRRKRRLLLPLLMNYFEWMLPYC